MIYNNIKKNKKYDYYGYCFMTIDELLKELKKINKSWVSKLIDSKEKILDEAYILEEKISMYDKKIVDKYLEQKVMVLKSSKLKILENIVTLFKKENDIKNIPINKKKFMFKNKIDVRNDNNESIM